MGTERLADNIHAIPLTQLPIAVGIALDKKLALDAEMSSQTLQPAAGPTINELLEQLRAFKRAAPRAVVNVQVNQLAALPAPSLPETPRS